MVSTSLPLRCPAGAISICLHLVLPSSRGLFKRAIMESGLCSFPFADAETGRRTTLALAKSVGCYVAPDSPAVAEALDNGTLANPAVSVVEDHESAEAAAAAATHYGAGSAGTLGVTHAAAGGTAAALERSLHKTRGRTAARAGVARRAADLAPPPLNIIEPDEQTGGYRQRPVQSWADIFADWGSRLQRSGAEWSATMRRRQEHSPGHLSLDQPLPAAGDWQPPETATAAEHTGTGTGTADEHGRNYIDNESQAPHTLSVMDGVRAVLLHPWTAAASLLPKARGGVSSDSLRAAHADAAHAVKRTNAAGPGRTGCRGSERLVRDAGAGGAFVVGRNWRHLARAMCGMRPAGGGNNTLDQTALSGSSNMHRSRTAQFVSMDAAGTPLEEHSGEPPLANLQLSPEEEELCLDELARWQAENPDDTDACMAAAEASEASSGTRAGSQVSLEEGKLEAAIAIAEREGIPVLPALASRLPHHHDARDDGAHAWIPAIDDAAVVAAGVLRGGQRWLLRAAAALENRARYILAHAGHAGATGTSEAGSPSTVECDEGDAAGSGAACPSAAERAAATTGHGGGEAGLAATAAGAVRTTGSWLRSLLVGTSPAAVTKPGAPEHAHPAAVGQHREAMTTAEAEAATQAQAEQPVVYRPLQLSLREMAADEVSRCVVPALHSHIPYHDATAWFGPAADQ